jgi:hypothetical protein
MTHPSSIDLEAFACGERPGAVSTHVAACAACAAHVARLEELLRAGRARKVPQLVIARARRDERARAAVSIASVAAPFLAAAGLLVLLRAPAAAPEAARPEQGPVAIADTARAPDPETSFKGGVQVAVIRQRGAQQARFTSIVRVQPGDRLRVEVALDREQDILAAVMGDDGSYLELMAPAQRAAGTHFSERSAKIDAAPTRGVIVVGSRGAVTRARETKSFDAVATLRVEWEAP